MAQPARTVIDITAAQVAQTSFVAGSVSDNLTQIRAFDGADWSQVPDIRWSPFNITVPANHAPVVTTADKLATRGQTFALSSLFTVSEPTTTPSHAISCGMPTTIPTAGIGW